jgi:Fe-S cluster biogenesis protein NfuA
MYEEACNVPISRFECRALWIRNGPFGLTLILLSGTFTRSRAAETREWVVEETISIIGEPTMNPAVCKFTVDRPVYAGGSAYFAKRETAALSPLAAKIFEVPVVQDILIAENQITITKSGFDPWPAVGKQIGAKIREHIHSCAPAVSEEFARSIPPEAEIRKKIQELLEREINPALGMHGGWVQLIDVKKNSVYLRLGGGCQGCGAANVTLKQGIERSIRELLPEVGEILDTTDHAAGRNPYYQSRN